MQVNFRNEKITENKHNKYSNFINDPLLDNFQTVVQPPSTPREEQNGTKSTRKTLENLADSILHQLGALKALLSNSSRRAFASLYRLASLAHTRKSSQTITQHVSESADTQTHENIWTLGTTTHPEHTRTWGRSLVKTNPFTARGV